MKSIGRLVKMIVTVVGAACVAFMTHVIAKAPHGSQPVIWTVLVVCVIVIAAKLMPRVRAILQWSGVAVMIVGGGITLYAILIAPFWAEMLVVAAVTGFLAWFIVMRFGSAR